MKNEISKLLTDWYSAHKRILPWRDIQDPYLIWLSEIILQQTQVVQGLAYYERFARQYPSVKTLAHANEDEVLKLWQGLGYYSRARNLLATAKNISDNYNGKFPETLNELKKLKGVGDYTAAAIASFAFKKPHAVVDGNVFRVLSRVFGIETYIDTSAGKKEFLELANQLLDKSQPATHNQAIMELGALVCNPVSPKCDACPLKKICHALENNMIKTLPRKRGKTKVKELYFNYLCISFQEKLFFRKRTKNDIWKNLYELPLIETPKKMELLELMQQKMWQAFFGDNRLIVSSEMKEFTHILSHRKISARFYSIELAGAAKKTSLMEQFFLITKEESYKLAIPKLIEKFMETC